MIAVSVAIIFLVRPISGLIAFTGSDLPEHKKWVISFFGIRGIGSMYYLSYGIYMAEFPQSDELWAITILIVVVSVLVHGGFYLFIVTNPYLVSNIDEHERVDDYPDTPFSSNQ